MISHYLPFETALNYHPCLIYPYIAGTVPEPTRALLARTWDAVVDVEQLDSGDATRLAVLKRPELGITFSKLNVWKLTQFTKVGRVDC